MTREEAEKIVRGITDKIECNTADIDDWAEFWGFTREDYEEFLDTAIKALEQEPCEDAVNRKEIQKKINRLWNSGGDKDYCMETLRDFVIDAPSVTPTRKKGEWCKQNDDYFDWYECSECGYGSEGEMQYSSECDVRTKYCPNCGAEMESKE